MLGEDSVVDYVLEGTLSITNVEASLVVDK